MMEFVVLCTLQVSGGYFSGVAHTEYVLTNSHAHCAKVAEARGVRPPFVSEEAIWFDNGVMRDYLAEICGRNLADCQLAINVPVEWRKKP